MFFHLQINATRFTDILRRHVERSVLTSERLGLGGIRQLPFEPLRMDVPPEPGVFHHLEIESVSFTRRPGEVETVTLTTPPRFFSRERPSTITLDVQPLEAHCVLRLFAVRVADLEAAGLSLHDRNS